MIIDDVYLRYQRHDIDWYNLTIVFNEIGEFPELYRKIIACAYRLSVQ